MRVAADEGVIYLNMYLNKRQEERPQNTKKKCYLGQLKPKKMLLNMQTAPLSKKSAIKHASMPEGLTI